MMLTPDPVAAAKMIEDHLDVALEVVVRTATGDGSGAAGVVAIHMLQIMQGGGDVDEAVGAYAGVMGLLAGSMMKAYLEKSDVEMTVLKDALRKGVRESVAAMRVAG